MAFESPVSILFDTEGRELNVSSSQTVLANQPGVVVYGSGSSGWETLRISPSGELFVTGALEATVGAVDQGNQGTIAQSWFVEITDGTQVLGTGSSAPLFITGSVGVVNAITIDDSTPIDVNVTNTVTVTGSVGISEVVSVTGSVALSETANVTGSVSVDSIASPVTTRPIDCTTTVVTGFNATTSSITVLSSNTTRCGATFFNDGKSIAYIKLGATASTASYTVKLNNNGYFEIPDNYTGQVDVVFDDEKPGDTLRITEIAE